MRLAAQEGLVPGETFAERLAQLARLGYDGVELSGRRPREEAQEVVVVDARGAAGAGGVTASRGATAPTAWPIGGPTP